MEVRRRVSTAEVARCSFKDKAIAEVDVLLFKLLAYNVLTPAQVITPAYQLAIDAVTKCLQLFAEDQQYVHSSISLSYC
jgi:wyosine [tRNA(Phe)-imidazoG37] synthetase (radical SAM superfamily)